MEEQSKHSHSIGDPVIRNIKDESVLAKTGKRWQEWDATLDDWGAREKDLAQIASHLREDCALSEWWATIIARRYRWVRGLQR